MFKHLTHNLVSACCLALALVASISCTEASQTKKCGPKIAGMDFAESIFGADDPDAPSGSSQFVEPGVYRDSLFFLYTNAFPESKEIAAYIEVFNRAAAKTYISSMVQLRERFSDMSIDSLRILCPVQIKDLDKNIRSPKMRSVIQKAATMAQGYDGMHQFEQMNDALDAINVNEYSWRYQTPWNFNAKAFYDKSQFVDEIESYVQGHLTQSNARKADTLYCRNMYRTIVRKYNSSSDTDVRCILAIEAILYADILDYTDVNESIDRMGKLLEEERYSRYLYDVWLTWRGFMQRSVFGPSTFSHIPDIYYTRVSQFCHKAILKQLLADPDDPSPYYVAAKFFSTGSMIRMGGAFGIM